MWACGSVVVDSVWVLVYVMVFVGGFVWAGCVFVCVGGVCVGVC